MRLDSAEFRARAFDAQGATVAEIADAFEILEARVEELVIQWRRDGSFVAAEFREGDVVSISVAGPMVTADSKLDLGEGFELTNMRFEADALKADVRVLDGAAPGPRSIRILDTSGNLLGEKTDGVRIVERKVEPRGGAKRKAKAKTKRRSGGKKKRKGGGSG